MNEAIKIAIEGGLKEGEKWQFVRANKYWAIWLDGNGTETPININNYLLDPLFWQALGKAMGAEGTVCILDGSEIEKNKCILNGHYDWDCDFIPVWKWEWHRFIDHLASGGDAETFFADLITKTT